MNLHQSNSFVNRTQLPLLCEKSGAILLVPVGFTAGRQSDEILVDLEILYILYRAFNEVTVFVIVLPINAYQSVFQVKYM